MGTANTAASAGITPTMIFAAVLAACGAIITISNAVEKVVKAWKAAKAPNDAQNARLAALEHWRDTELKDWQKEVEHKLNRDKEQLDDIHDGLRASYQAQLALLEHGIDGNNIKQMQDAKEALQKHLINHH